MSTTARGNLQAPQSFRCEPLERRVLMAAGDLDLAFGSGGQVVTPFPGYERFVPASNAIVPLPDGRFVVAGYVENTQNDDFAIARYNADGTPDVTFGQGDGQVVVSPSSLLSGADSGREFARTVAISEDGHLFVGGDLTNGVQIRWMVVRLNADGTVDQSYGTNGVAVDAAPGGGSTCESVRLDAQGRVVLAVGRGFSIEVTRLQIDGSLDTTFNGSGLNSKVFVDYNAGSADLAIQQNGGIIVGATVNAKSGAGGTTKYLCGLARINSDGTLDPAFGQAGVAISDPATALSINSRFNGLSSVAIDSEDRIYTSGEIDDIRVSVVGRYLPEGGVDSSFGQRHTGFTVLRQGEESRFDHLALQPDGKAVVAANTNPFGDSKIFVERLGIDGLPDQDFSGDGVVVFDSPAPIAVPGVQTAADGGLIVVGAPVEGNNLSDTIITRLQGDSPQVRLTGAWVASSAWSAGFRQSLEAEGAGAADLGFALGDDPNAPPLPWINLDTIAVRWTSSAAAATVVAALSRTLSVVADAKPIAVQSIAPSPADPSVAIIRLSTPLRAGRTRLRIRTAQNSAGDVFDVAIPVLPGDVDKSGGAVNASDLVRVRNGVGRTAANPGTGSSAYRTLVDLNGDSVVNASDLVLVRNRIGTPISDNLVVNGGFEQVSFTGVYRIWYPRDSSLTGWRIDGAGIGHIGTYWQASEGKQSIELNQFASSGVSQHVPTQPGRQYRISFDLAGQPDAGPAVKQLQVFWDGSLVKTESFDVTGKTLSNMGWSRREVIVTARGNSTLLRFFGAVPASVDGGPALDNVSVTPFNAPAVVSPAAPVRFGSAEFQKLAQGRRLIDELL